MNHHILFVTYLLQDVGEDAAPTETKRCSSTCKYQTDPDKNRTSFHHAESDRPDAPTGALLSAVCTYTACNNRL